jgi:hypothetical protein
MECVLKKPKANPVLHATHCGEVRGILRDGDRLVFGFLIGKSNEDINEPAVLRIFLNL